MTNNTKMEARELISVIVPVYNVEPYLRKCVESITGQSYTNIEIILVDDGSTDTSGIMCDELSRSDDRIQVVHKENGGLSSARNAGIDVAKGDLISFIDSDDYVDADMLETLYRNLKTEGADLSICGIYQVYQDKDVEISKPYYEVMDACRAIEVAYAGSFSAISAVNKLYRREIFDTVRFPFGKIFEDAFVTVDVFMQCKKIVITAEQKYYYYHRENSITTNHFSSKMFDLIEAYQKNYKLIEDNYPAIINVAEGRLFWANLYVLDHLIVSEEEQEYLTDEKKILSFLKRNRKKIFANSLLNRNRKLSFAVLLFSKRLYRMLVMYNLRKNYKAYRG